MITLTTLECFNISGVGTAHNIGAVAGLNPRTLIGRRVILDGSEVTVRRVETFAVVDPTGQPFAVVVASASPSKS